MRIIAGKLGGRLFDSPRTQKTHPMSERVRGALFNILSDIEDLTVLDAFSGSGALAFEAISRGAKKVITIESDRIAQRTIERNITTLGITTQIKLIKGSANSWLNTNSDARFDVVLCDPPFDDLQMDLISSLTNLIESSGTFVISWPGKQEVPAFGKLKEIKRHSYGDIQLIFFIKS